MACFLKKAKQSNNLYLAIYESFYSPKTNGTKHHCVKSLGSITALQRKGIEDPIAFYQAEVDRMNTERKKDQVKRITDISPIRYLGYFPLKALLEKLDISTHIGYFKYTTDYSFDLYEILSSLIYARAVSPCSKLKTYNEIIPCLYQQYSFSYDQLLDGLEFYGNDYEKIVEMFTGQVKDKFKLNTEVTYFDCTNFYFEIDREDDFRKKGPSKENSKDPIVGLGLLLDAHQIPIGMKMYPGNESEKPIIREVITELKEKHEIKGRTIEVADKGLNCANNIFYAKQNGDGYLFSKSVKQLPQKEKVWVLLNQDYKAVKDNEGNVLYYYKECVDEFEYLYTDEKDKKHRLELTEKRVVTFNPSLAKKKRYEINRLVEKAKGLSASMAKKNEYGECSKYVSFKSTSKGKETEDKIKAVLNQEAVKEDLRLAGFNLLVTSEVKMSAKDIYDTYHNLWRIEESFRIMKSDLDARPVFLQKEKTIKGHFLICYLTVLLERLFQFYVLENKYSSSTIFNFFKGFKLVEGEDKFINISILYDFITQLAQSTSLPLDHYSLSKNKINRILNYKF